MMKHQLSLAGLKGFKRHGFSLIETLISLVIVSALSLLSYQTKQISQSFQTHQAQTLSLHEFEKISLFENWLESHPSFNLEEHSPSHWQSLSTCLFFQSANNASCQLNKLADTSHHIIFDNTLNAWLITHHSLSPLNQQQCLDSGSIWITKNAACYQPLL